jgi:hypothetical protein
MLGVPEITEVGDHNRGHGEQLVQDPARLVEPTHQGVAGGEIAIAVWGRRTVLDSEEQFRQRLLEAPSEKMSITYYSNRWTDPRARAQAERNFLMLDRDVRLPRPES